MGKSSTKSLKAALKSQQSRFKSKEKQTHAAQVADQKSKAKKSGQKPKKPIAAVNEKGKGKATPQKMTVPFAVTDSILLVGEGNFSFAHALVYDPPHQLEHFPPVNLTATAYDTEEECYEKYPESQAIVARLREKGVRVIFAVDATKLERHAALKGKQWDKIVWNFPHAGKGITDQDRNILSNQVLVLDFLRSAAHLLVRGPIPFAKSTRKKKSEDDDDDGTLDNDTTIHDDDERTSARSRGTVLITLRNVKPYILWDVPLLAKKPPPPTGSTPPNPHYMVVRSFAFIREAWKGYEHRMTKGERAHGNGITGEGGEDRTWEFCIGRVNAT
ncbi:hypothetical protein BDN71DRAFT_1510997 [Pleurotus eryngii]|uniref:25S rRNA (uridine-N(3))-methyltransferase BMT5-like domain-containing protein n=1 Tax=Pleurotus eryngii TaxID=5323 RepID=A0A9P5ZQX2_PLEER|nr:hypothetical protein BDN71DRAFT_1510997 [Pleurotus eryngii]